MTNIHLNYIVKFTLFFFFILLNYSVLFFNEEFFIGFFMILFFSLLYIFLRKNVKLLFFYSIDHIYFTFYFLLDFLIFFLNYVINLVSFLDRNLNLIYYLETFYLVFSKTLLFFSINISEQNNDFSLFFDFCVNNSSSINNFILQDELFIDELLFNVNSLFRFVDSYEEFLIK